MPMAVAYLRVLAPWSSVAPSRKSDSTASSQSFSRWVLASVLPFATASRALFMAAASNGGTSGFGIWAKASPQ